MGTVSTIVQVTKDKMPAVVKTAQAVADIAKCVSAVGAVVVQAPPIRACTTCTDASSQVSCRHSLGMITAVSIVVSFFFIVVTIFQFI